VVLAINLSLTIKNNRKMEAKTQKVVEVKASYELLETFYNVLIKFPGKGDKMNYVTEHDFRDCSGKLIRVYTHFNKVDYYNGAAVIRNFYIYPGLRGRTLVVDEVKVREKKDVYRRGRKTFVLDIILKGFEDKKVKPTSKLSVGCPSGKYPIPGAPGKFIDFKLIA